MELKMEHISKKCLFGICLINQKLRDLLLYRRVLRTCIFGYFRRRTMKRREIDMRLFRLEVKRIMKSRRTLILFTVALLMSIVMAYLPISFESINQPGENGEVIELDGIPAIQFKKDYYEKTAGEITPQKLAEALRTYQSYVKEYGTLDDVPLDIYIENIMAIRPMLKGLTEAFADSKTGMAAVIVFYVVRNMDV